MLKSVYGVSMAPKVILQEWDKLFVHTTDKWSHQTSIDSIKKVCSDIVPFYTLVTRTILGMTLSLSMARYDEINVTQSSENADINKSVVDALCVDGGGVCLEDNGRGEDNVHDDIVNIY